MHVEIDPVYETIRRRELKQLKNRRKQLTDPLITQQQQPGQNHPMERPYSPEKLGRRMVTGHRLREPIQKSLANQSQIDGQTSGLRLTLQRTEEVTSHGDETSAYQLRSSANN
ncbi:unnamed protein product [Dicrocoelium dendriticum]|nr:unnamed protein product [Dicrocoelium dendriticum]